MVFGTLKINRQKVKNKEAYISRNKVVIYIFIWQARTRSARANRHTDAKTTKKYMVGHVEWLQIQAAELVV